MCIREEPSTRVSARVASHLGTTGKMSLKAVSGEQSLSSSSLRVIRLHFPQDFSINII